MFWSKKGKDKEKLYVIVGLGNPGSKYTATRHNAGFLAIDRLMDRYGIRLSSKKFSGLSGRGTIGDRKVLLVKPTTFMNNSGECLRKIVDFYKLDPAKDVCVIYDDIDLKTGAMRIRTKGSAGSHNGMKSIIAHLGSNEFTRIRIGVGAPPPPVDLADWVLGKIPKAEIPLIRDVCDDICDAMEEIVDGKTEAVMNRYNRKK